VASDLPTVKEYRIYRTRLAEFSTPRYRLYARLDPACLDPGVRCVVDAGKTCVDPTSWVPNHEDPALACPIISPEPCDDSNGPRCAIVDAIFAEWPALTDPVQNQYYYNYRYFVTAVGVWCPEDGGPCVETESMPSPENQGWLNYRKAQIDGSYTWLDRRDPDGDGQFMVCGDENVHFYPDLIDVDASDASIAVSLVAPHRTLGQPVPGDGGGDGGSGGGNPYNPPARFVYYHLDHLGSPRVVVDGNGVVQARHHFLPFGEERPAPYEQTLNNRAFTGHERDGDTGLDYMLARYYSSSLARFMAVDPGDSVEEEDPQSWNRYSYTKNNPLKYNDPDGESPTLVTAAAGFGVGALIRGGWELGKQVHAGNGVDWQKVGAKALSGGIEGAVAGATAGLGLISFMGANTAATVGAGILERGIDGDSSTGAPLDAGEMGEDLAAGAIGSLGGKLFQGVATGDWKTVEIGTRGLGEWEKASAQSAVKTGMSATKTAVTTGAQAMGGKKQPASKVDQKIQAMKERAKQGPAKKQK
jgi:RHS repeat-associated protein